MDDDEFTGPLAELLETLAWDPASITYDPTEMGVRSQYDADEREEQMQIAMQRLAAREQLASELTDGLSTEATVEAEPPEPPGHFAIGPPPDDTVWLAIHFMEAYAAVRFVADDLRRVIDRIRARAKKPIRINRSAAQVLAWDAVVASGEHQKIELQYFAPMFVGMRIEMFQNDSEDGWLFAFVADGTQINVVVRSDGEVLGLSLAPDQAIVEKLDPTRHRARRRKKS